MLQFRQKQMTSFLTDFAKICYFSETYIAICDIIKETTHLLQRTEQDLETGNLLNIRAKMPELDILRMTEILIS